MLLFALSVPEEPRARSEDHVFLLMSLALHAHWCTRTFWCLIVAVPWTLGGNGGVDFLQHADKSAGSRQVVLETACSRTSMVR